MKKTFFVTNEKDYSLNITCEKYLRRTCGFPNSDWELLA